MFRIFLSFGNHGNGRTMNNEIWLLLTKSSFDGCKIKEVKIGPGHGTNLATGHMFLSGPNKITTDQTIGTSDPDKLLVGIVQAINAFNAY